MATAHDNIFRSFLANEAMSANRAVVLSSNGGVGLAGTTGRHIGFTEEDVASGSYANVRLLRPTAMASVTAQPITAADVVFLGASGQVSTTGTVTAGVALEGAAANGIVIEILPLEKGSV